LALAVVVGSGCGQSNKPPPPSADVQVIDATQFRPAFGSAPPETQALVDKVMMSLQASDYMSALSQLETLTNTPGLTEPQQKVAVNLTDQITKKLASTPPPGQ
jgi:hypothetical protein